MKNQPCDQIEDRLRKQFNSQTNYQFRYYHSYYPLPNNRFFDPSFMQIYPKFEDRLLMLGCRSKDEITKLTP